MRDKRFYREIFLIFGGIVLGMAGIEGLVRLYFSVKMDYHIEMWKYATRLKRPSPDPALSHEHVPGAEDVLMGVRVRINQYGMRGREYSRKKPTGVYRILLVGDSIALGWGVPEERTLSSLLEARLNQNPTLYSAHTPSGVRNRFEVINAGVGNHNTTQELAHLRKNGMSFKPDLLLLLYFINDAEPVSTPARNPLLGRSQAAVIVWSRLDTLLRKFGGRKDYVQHYREIFAEGSAGRADSFRALVEMNRLAKKTGSNFAIAFFPDLHNLVGYPFRSIHNLVGGFAQSRGVPFIDLLPVFEGVKEPMMLWVSADDAHPNGRANRMAARGVLRGLVKAGLLRQ